MTVLSAPFGARPREDQFLADLANLFRRHRVRTGSPEYLPLLASVLEVNDALRTDLLMLCNAISRMAESDLAPEELLQLVAKAVAGPRSTDGELRIPEDLKELFISSWHKWQARAESLSAFHWGDGASAEGVAVEADGEKTSIGKFSAAASRKIQAAADETPAAADAEVTPETRIGELTISQLRSYLDEIEQQVGRLQPFLAKLQESLPEAATPPAANIEPLSPAGKNDRDEARHIPLGATTPATVASLVDRHNVPGPLSAHESTAPARVTKIGEQEPMLRHPLRSSVREDEADVAAPTLFRMVAEPERTRSRTSLWVAAALLLAMPAAYFGKAYLYPAPATMPVTRPAAPGYAPPPNDVAPVPTSNLGSPQATAPRRSAAPGPRHLLPRAIQMEAQAARAEGHESHGGTAAEASPAGR